MARAVLFWDPEIAKFINDNFEPAWVSVRKVPIVNIDFGNGKVVKRTLNGNIATYICASDGKVLDVLPGLYEPGAYKDRLQQLVLLNKYLAQQPRNHKENSLVSYHQIQWQRLQQGKAPARFLKQGTSIKLSSNLADINKDWSQPMDEKSAYSRKPLPKENLALWKQLTDDVRYNETEMRRKIHEKLICHPAAESLPTVAMLTKWMYREVLHADIDDPFLGMGPVLDGTYPFDKYPRMQ